MKKFALFALLGALAMSAPTVFAKPAKKTTVARVNWAPSYWAAQQAAKRTGKPLFIDFYTDWCGPCKYLEQTTYRDSRFIAYSRGWIMVKVNPEKSALGAKLAEKYKVQGYPSMIFTDGSGKKRGEAVGTYPAQMLISEMKKAAKKVSGTRI